MLAMPDDKPIELVGINFNKSSGWTGQYISAFQVVLSNGETSPVFLGLGEV